MSRALGSKGSVENQVAAGHDCKDLACWNVIRLILKRAGRPSWLGFIDWDARRASWTGSALATQ
jgi:hypothetical protein